MTSPTMDTGSAQRPRVQAIQMHARLIYEDGTVAAVATQPSEMPRDEIDQSISISEEELIRQLEAHCEVVVARVQNAGSQALYEAATAEAQSRRDNVNKRAILARQQKQQELQAGQPYHEIGRKPNS